MLAPENQNSGSRGTEKLSASGFGNVGFMGVGSTPVQDSGLKAFGLLGTF